MPGTMFSRAKPTARSLELKEAIIASFVLEPGEACRRLAGFDEADWLSVMWWLDVSGMAIYSLDLVQRIGAGEMIPRNVQASLAQRLKNNGIRMEALRHESYAVAECFESENIPYALLKGITLAPESAPRSELRCQTDLDFLVAERSEQQAIRAIGQLGYRLHARSGNTLEFRAGVMPLPDLANLYTVHTLRALELHLLPESNSESNRLERRVNRDFNGFRIDALAPADILVQQALHLLKHLCGEHTRLSWVLEFWRHVNVREGDDGFWRGVELVATESMNADLAMGVASSLAAQFFGKPAGLPARWSAEALPVRVRLWLERYARRLLVSDAVGSKLYALLRREVPSAAHETRKTRDILLPRVLPAPLLESQSGESLADRWKRYGIETQFLLRRLGFHIREGVRFAVESPRWSRAVAREER
jgi:hypothetical protein